MQSCRHVSSFDVFGADRHANVARRAATPLKSARSRSSPSSSAQRPSATAEVSQIARASSVRSVSSVKLEWSRSRPRLARVFRQWLQGAPARPASRFPVSYRAIVSRESCPTRRSRSRGGCVRSGRPVPCYARESNDLLDDTSVVRGEIPSRQTQPSGTRAPQRRRQPHRIVGDVTAGEQLSHLRQLRLAVLHGAALIRWGRRPPVQPGRRAPRPHGIVSTVGWAASIVRRSDVAAAAYPGRSKCSWAGRSSVASVRSVSRKPRRSSTRRLAAFGSSVLARTGVCPAPT